MEEKELKGKLRFAKPSDAAALLEIYAPYILETAISFEYEVPTVEEFAERIAGITEKYPWIVYEDESGRILGYAYGGPDHTRAAYQWTVEDSIYIRKEARGLGLGKLMLEKLLELLKEQNFCICYALIVDDNEPSLKLHDKFGFTECGNAKNTGFKLGAWHGIITLEKQLNPPEIPPKPIIPFPKANFSL